MQRATLSLTGTRILMFGLLLAAAPAQAARLSVQLDGLDGELEHAALAGLEASQYAKRDVTEAQARRLYEHADAEVREALQPYGYFNARVVGELKQEGEDFVAVLHVTRGEPVRVTRLDISIDGNAAGQREIEKVVAAFHPQKGQPLDQAAYERSKAAIQTALSGNGYLDVQATTHEIEVDRGSNSAVIKLTWKVGPRYRVGATRFEGGQLPDSFLERYIPWKEGDFYSQDKLLALQRRLIDADYFSIAQVRPDIAQAHDDIVPISVLLAPAKRTVYTGGIGIGTDTGAGVQGGIERRWLNSSGHKLKLDTIIAQRLKTAVALYQIPLAGPDNHSVNFGLGYRDENTDTSQSNTFHAGANDSRVWRGWTRAIGLQFLTGDFTVADEKGTTTLLYPEISAARKSADDFNFPRRGYSLTLAARAGHDGVLSDTSFAQVTADAKWIRGIGSNDRFIARGSLGATRVGDFDKLPPELRFFAGGARSIRGYDYQTIGPRNVDGKVIGGENLAVASAEYEHYFTPAWGMATFVDAGDAFTGTDFSLKVGAGAGVRWRSPVGMVRVDIGVPIGDKYASGFALAIVIGPDL